MDFQDLTQIVAIVGSVAVVVSLIYASAQLRHTTRALMATGRLRGNHGAEAPAQST